MLEKNHNFFLKKIILSLISVISINLRIIIIKIRTNKKVIFFYHPENNLISISSGYINFFFSNKNNFNIFIGHASTNSNELNKNYYFINQKFIKLIFGVNFFMSSYINDIFPINCKKIYLHHDIYDTPLVNKSFEKLIFKKISKFNFIIVSSERIKLEFYRKFNKFLEKKIKPKILVTGYLKLQYLYDKKRRYKPKKNSNIIIAPTNFTVWKKFNLITKLERIILVLLNKTKYNVYLRFHPSNINHIFAKKIALKFNDNKRFFLDKSSDYFNSYMNTVCMITDMSGTAYTYSFITKKPIVFFLKNEKKLLQQSNYKDLDYFKDREKIGIIANNISEIPYKIYKVLKNKSKITKNINKLCKNVYDNKNPPCKKIISIINELSK